MKGGIETVLAGYYEHKIVSGRHEKTIAAHRKILEPFGEYVRARGIDWRALPPECATEFLTKHLDGRRPPLPVEVSALRQFLRFLQRFHGIDTERARAMLPTPKRGRRVLRRVLTVAEVGRILAASSKHRANLRDRATVRDRVAADVMYAGGVRPGELRRLTLVDWDSRKRDLTIRRSKIGTTDVVRLASPTARMLDEYLRDVRPRMSKASKAPWLFPTLRGNMHTKNRLCHAMRRCGQRAGIDRNITPYDFRHAAATHMMEKGASVVDVSRFLRHRCLQTTTIYTHVSGRFLNEQHRRFHPRGRRR